MKRILIFSLITIIAGISIFSCNNDKMDDIFHDLRFETEVINSSKLDLSTLCLNSPVNFNVQIKKNDPQIIYYNFSYVQSEGNGLLYYRDSLLRPGIPIECNEQDIELKYIPTSLNDHRLLLKFNNSEVNVSDEFKGKVTKYYFDAKAENIPVKILIDKPFIFDLKISKAYESDKINQFRTTAQIMNGVGKVIILNSLDSLNSYLKAGSNQISYTGQTVGKNVVQFKIFNEYDYSQTIEVPFTIQLPEFTASVSSDSVADAGSINHFLLSVNDVDTHKDNQYFVTYRPLENNGTIKINTVELVPGGTLEIPLGESVGEYIPNDLGNARIEFLIKDKYNTIQKDTLDLDVIKSQTQISISNYTPEATVYDQQTFNLAVYKKNYQNGFQLEIIQQPANAGTLTINGIQYQGGRLPITNINNTIIGFIPQSTGNTALTLKVIDDFNSESEKTLDFNIGNNQGQIIVSNQNPSINLLNPTSFNFSVQKRNYTGAFQFEIKSDPINSGSIKINGKLYEGGRVDLVNPNNTLVSFTPSITDEITLSVIVYDNFGGIIKEDLFYSVANTDINIVVNSLEKELIVGKETNFNFNVDKPFYNGKLDFNIEILPVVMGTIRVNGEDYYAGLSNSKISNGSSVSVSFLPQKEGKVTLMLSVADNFMGIKKYPITFDVANPPIRMEVSNFNMEGLINTMNSFNFSISKQNYKGKYKYSIKTVPNNVGKIFVNNVGFDGGLTDLPTPDNTRLDFIPNTSGDISLVLTITDELNSKLEREFTYKIANPDLQLLLSSVEDDLTLNKRSTFHFTISKAGYQGKFHFEITGENCKDIRVANVPYENGQRLEVPNITGTSVSFTPEIVGQDIVKLLLRLYDDWGMSVEKTLVFSVNNSDINLELDQVESQLFIGKTSNFEITASKAQYTGNLYLEIISQPSDKGIFKIDNEVYVSGLRTLKSGTTTNISFLPKSSGTANVQIVVSDGFGGEKKRSFNYTITNPDLEVQINNFISSAILDKESNWNIGVKKNFYEGKFNLNITTLPLNAGIFRVNDKEYSGGEIMLDNPENTKITFIPNTCGEISINLDLSDQTNLVQQRTLKLNVTDYPIDLIIANQETGLTIDKTTSFNFSTAKKGYTGKFQYEIIQNPANSGSILVNGKTYTGGRSDISNTTNTRVQFTPTSLGDLSLILKVYDDHGEQSKELNFFVENSDFNVIISNLEKDILRGKDTEFNFSLQKENYSGQYKIEFIQDPEETGKIYFNETLYNSGKINVTNPVNSIVRFTPSIAGSINLQLKFYDENGGAISKLVTYNCINPPIETTINGKEENIIINTPSKINLTLNKEYYNEEYDIQIVQLPANSCEILLNGEEYTGGVTTISNPNNIPIQFTPIKEGHFTATLHISDKVGGKIEKDLSFAVLNDPIQLNINEHQADIIVNQPTNFNFTVSKGNYGKTFKYQITQEPAAFGTIKVNNTVYNGAKLDIANPDNNSVTFAAEKIGAVTLKLTVFDEWGKTATKLIPFSVSNSDIQLVYSGKEFELLLGKMTALDFNVTKPNYSGNFQAQISCEPENCGTFILNGSAYSGNWIAVKKLNNHIEYTPDIIGANLVKLKIKDELGGEKEVPLNFNVTNPSINMQITNKESVLVYNTPTNFNLAVDKAYYNDKFQIQIVQVPANFGKVSINGKEYNGGIIDIIDPKNCQVSFVPSREGNVSLRASVNDLVGGRNDHSIDFTVINPDIELNISNKKEDIVVNQPTNFNFTISKENYGKTFKYQITQEPAAFGTIKVNNTVYNGAKLDIANPDNNSVTFAAEKIGAVTLKLTVFDEWGKTATKLIPFSVSNSDIQLVYSGKEFELLLGKTTALDFNVTKPNYSGNFQAQISCEPENCGTLILNGSAYSGNWIAVKKLNNHIEYTPDIIGANLVKLKIKDELGGEKEVPLNFNVTNPSINMQITNKESVLVYNTPTNFNLAVDKAYYNDKFQIQIVQVPANSGKVSINGKEYNGGIIDIIDPKNCQVGFVPSREGHITLRLKVTDMVGGYTEELLDFDAQNPGIDVNISNKQDDIIVNTSARFNFTISKNNYTGKFRYQISREPASYSGSLKVNNTVYTGGKLEVSDINNNTVEFTPAEIGTVILRLDISDDWGQVNTNYLRFNITNTPINLTINNTGQDIIIGEPVKFSVKAEKDNYSGNYEYELTPYPYNCGTITPELTGTLNVAAKEFTFIPYTLGAISLKLKVTDVWGTIAEKQINYQISNTPITIQVSNNEENITVKQTTNFNLAVVKNNYSDDRNIFYSISPSNGVSINNQVYDGGVLQTKYASIKKGIPVSYLPDRSGNTGLTITVSDDYNQQAQKTINYNISDPELNFFLTGIEENKSNSVNLNETFKFTLNVSKNYYSDEFAYWISLSPADAGLIAANDITPKTRTATDNGIITGTIKSSEFNVSTAEVRFTANNSSYIDKDIVATIKIRDKWGNEKNKTVTFTPTTNAIMVDVVRNKNSIPVQQPYLFYYTVQKPHYTGNFKFNIVGAADDDKIEISEDGTNFSIYNGGKFPVLNADHSYIRITPYSTGTTPLKLFVYDETNTYVEKDITFDVKAPTVKIAGGGIKSGETNTYIPFDLTATDEAGENLYANFVTDPALDGIVLFNKNNVNMNTRSSISVSSGTVNTLEMLSRSIGEYSTETVVSNKWNQTASAHSTIKVSKPIKYTLQTSKSGEGSITISNQKAEYNPNEIITLTANAASGWQLVRWEGDLSGSKTEQQIIMNSNKTVKAVFEKIPVQTVDLHIHSEYNLPNTTLYYKSVYLQVTIKEKNSGKVIFDQTVFSNDKFREDFQAQIDQTLDYELTIFSSYPRKVTSMDNYKYEMTNKTLTVNFANSSYSFPSSGSSQVIKGEAFIGTTKKNTINMMFYYQVGG